MTDHRIHGSIAYFGLIMSFLSIKVQIKYLKSKLFNRRGGLGLSFGKTDFRLFVLLHLGS